MSRPNSASRTHPACSRAGREPTHREPAGEIQRRYGYRDFVDPGEHVRLVRWLYARAWVDAERPSLRFDLATARLVERKVLLPGVTVLARLVARVRDRVAERLWSTLARAPTPEQRAALERLVIVLPDARQTPLDRLRHGPTRANAGALVGALTRLRQIRALDAGALDLASIPPSRLAALARHAATSWAATVARMAPERRVATLLAFARVYEARAQDDALDVLDSLIAALLARVEREGDRARLRSLRDLDKAALILRDACRVLRDPAVADATVRDAVARTLGARDLGAAIEAVSTLTRLADDHYYDDLLSRYSTMRQFLPTLLRTITFDGTPAARSALDAVAFLRDIEGRKHPKMAEAPLDAISKAWRPLVRGPDGDVDRRAYTFATLERLQADLRRHDAFVAPSERWGDSRAKLLQGDAWTAARPQVCRSLVQEGLNKVALRR